MILVKVFGRVIQSNIKLKGLTIVLKRTLLVPECLLRIGPKAETLFAVVTEAKAAQHES